MSSFLMSYRIPRKEDYDDLYCTDGVCDVLDCCDPFVPAPLYKTLPVLPIGATYYVYDDKDEAREACEMYHEDMTLCTWDQILGLTTTDTVAMCTFGWFEDGEDGERGFYVSEDQAARGHCQGRAGPRFEPPPANNLGSAHCCVPSYKNDGRNQLGTEQTGVNAEAYCAGQLYQDSLCHKDQLQTISLVEDINICEGGWMRTDSGYDSGWWQGEARLANGALACGTPGFKEWAPEYEQTAHCCTDYVVHYVEPILPYRRFGGNYVLSPYDSGEAADADCILNGYEGGLCTKGQVGYVGTESWLDTTMCELGWHKNEDGTFGAGYYQTEATCGPQSTWIDIALLGGFANFPGNPLAHCCQPTSHATLAVGEIAFRAAAYINGDWDYNYSTEAEAQWKCESLSEGTNNYDLCTMAQIYTVAVHGAPNSDLTIQTEANICRNGWYADDMGGAGGWGWWQANDQCGSSGWRSFTSTGGKYGYHCCLNNFPAEDLPQPTMMPTKGTLPAFTKATDGSYSLYSEQAARNACQTIHSSYTLCSDAQVTEVAFNGAPGDGGDFRAVAAQDDLCYAGWVDSTNSCPGIIKGWYQVNPRPGCGDAQWNTYSPASPPGSETPYAAGGFCCAPSVVVTDSLAWTVELDCVVATEAPDTEYTDASADVGIADIYTRDSDNQYYVKVGDDYQRTCVGAGASAMSCDYGSVVCAGELRLTNGSVEARQTLLTEALAEADNVHGSCPPENCVAYSGYTPEGFASEVSYCVADDGCYYWNGQHTCVCNDNVADIDVALKEAFENSFQFLNPQCANPDMYDRPHDQVMNDQLMVTEQMVNDLEDKVQGLADVNEQLAAAEAELISVWEGWELEIRTTLETARATTTDQATIDSINQVLADLEALGTNP
eukprot:UN32195